MRIEEIRERTDEELGTLVKQLHEDLYKLRVQKTTNQLEDTNAPHRIRKDLARVMTVIRARELKIEVSKRVLEE